MGKELAETLEPSVPQEEIDAAETVQEASQGPTEQAPDTTSEDKAKEAPKPDKTVPLAALHEERQRRKELQQQVALSAQRQAQMEARFQAYMQEQSRQAQLAQVPAYETDPIANLKFTQEQNQQELQQLREWRARQEQDYAVRVQQEQYVNHIASEVNRSESEFARENPDYVDAVKHLKTLRAAQLEAFGMAQPQIQAYVHNEAFQIAENALRNGQNPADVAYRMAKASGWAGKKVDAPEQKIETLQKGVKAAQSLGSGGKPAGNVTLEQLADMPDDEFRAFMKAGKWEKLG